MSKLTAKITKSMGITEARRMLLYGICVALLIYPFLIGIKLYQFSEKAKLFFRNTEGYGVDLMLGCKADYVIMVSILLLIIMCIDIFFIRKHTQIGFYRYKEYKIIGCLSLLYIFLVIISTIFSDFMWEALGGSFTEFESVFVLVAYMLIMVAGMYFFDTGASLKIFRNVFTIFVIIWVGLSIVEILYKPLLEIPVLQAFLFPDISKEVLVGIKNEEYRSMISLTMYNPNYYGGACLLIFSVIFELYLQVETKWKWLYLALSSLLIVCVIQCRATTAIYCVMIQVILFLILNLKKHPFILKKMALFLVGIIVCVAGFTVLTNGAFLATLQKGVANESQGIKEEDAFELETMKIDGGQLYFSDRNGKEFILNADLGEAITADGIDFTTNNKSVIETVIVENTVTFLGAEFEAISVEVENPVITIDFGYNQPAGFYFTTDGFKGVGPNRSVLEIKDAYYEQSDFDKVATGRGYTWRRSVPVLKECFVWGKGAGSFPYYFPQFDYVGLLNIHGSANFVIDKPHSMYIQVAERTGVLSLVCLMFLFVGCVVENIKLEIRKRESLFSCFRQGSFVAVVGWLIYSITNDSMVTVSPLFWFIFGMNLTVVICEKRGVTSEK